MKAPPGLPRYFGALFLEERRFFLGFCGGQPISRSCSLVIPKRILDGIIEMIYALDKIAPGTANDDTLLYGVEVKFYNMEVSVNENLETAHKGLFIIGDGSGITHSLSHASASGVYVARHLAAQSTEAPTAP